MLLKHANACVNVLTLQRNGWNWNPRAKTILTPPCIPLYWKMNWEGIVKKKRTKDQEKFEEEAEQALEGDDKKTSLRL